MDNLVPNQIAKSTFVTALAWVFIGLAGFATFISVLQNVMITLMFPAEAMQAAANQAGSDEHMPWFAAFMFQNIRLFFFGFLLLSSTTVAAAIGLLRRKNWARIMFIGLMVFGILQSIGGVVFSIVFFTAMPTFPSTAPPDFANQFELISKLMIGVNIVMAIGFSVLFGWIVKRLLSPAIRREFSSKAQRGQVF